MSFPCSETVKELTRYRSCVGMHTKYSIRKYVELFDKISKNFKEDYLSLNRVGYFDEQFEELKIDKICKKVGIDKKDIDEI